MHAKHLVAALAITLLSAAPALASAACYATPNGVTLNLDLDYSFSFGNGGSGWQRSDERQAARDLALLRRAGIDAVSTERWGGCIRAYVRRPGGGESMELYNPTTLQRVN